MRRLVAGLAFAATTVLAACSSPAWPKTAAETTCAEWSNQMTSSQRDSFGTAILMALRASDGGKYAPRDAVIQAYVKAITDTCKDNPDAKLSTVGATLYGLSKDLHP
ncbi:MAG TPA: hypothetical protein VJ850_00865 [Candidatus Limnocylindrales bacterium]|nr:hypothetical protein [Candidatus Limnocylindrales bacterium]